MVPAVLVRPNHLPLAPIPTSAATSFVVETGLRFPHRTLVLFHLDPGPAGWVKRAPDRGNHAEDHQQVADDDRHDGLLGLLYGTLEVVVLEPHDAQTQPGEVNQHDQDASVKEVGHGYPWTRVQDTAPHRHDANGHLEQDAY